ncbi:MAG: hypothetical protein J0M17_03975, partial [Planctomycetes bacterium]|nr:hypothetical protein [Planctomycetota bacterium]
AFLPVARFEEGRHVFFATQRGTVKKTDLMAYSNRRAAGIVAKCPTAAKARTVPTIARRQAWSIRRMAKLLRS